MKKRWKIIGLIVLIIVVVLGVASPFVCIQWRQFKDEFMKEEIELVLKLSIAVGLYNVQEKTELTDINQLVPEYFAEVPKDSYGTPYKLRKEGEKYAILSAGPDKEFNTKDDTRISFTSTFKAEMDKSLSDEGLKEFIQKLSDKELSDFLKKKEKQ